MLTPGTELQNRYEIVGLLAQGGMGCVYRAFDRRLNRSVAIKERVPDPNATELGLAQARQQFQREAQTLAVLSQVNLPQIYDYFSSGANEYVVMELIEGQPLDQVVQRHGAINEGAVRAWANQVLDALIYIHGRNIIHRDIKPANLILKSEGRVVLVDFGLVKLVDPTNPGTATALRGMGTFEYAPLEQYSPGMHTDVRSDIYSLGATLYHLMAGWAPLDVAQRLIDPSQQAALRAMNPSISTQTEAVVQKAMEVYPQNRFQTAAEMKQALNVLSLPRAQTVPIPATILAPPVPAFAPPVAVPGAAAGSNRWMGWWLAAAVLVGLVAVWAVSTMFFPPTPRPGPISLTPSVGKATPPAPTPLAPALARASPSVPATSAPTLGPRVAAVPTGVRRGLDNAEMVPVSAGNFTMGSVNGEDSEKPEHTVYLDDFWIDQFEVTNALYKKCVDAGKCQPPPSIGSWTRASYYGNAQFDDYPVIYVTWTDADAYCAWAGKRLPTEAEWEKAARGTDQRVYPWGDVFDKTLLNSSEGGLGDTTVVGNFPGGASPYGAMDMAGNVLEWVADSYDSAYYAISPRVNPKGPAAGDYKVLRGGSWFSGQYDARSSFRRSFGISGLRYGFVGFRCAQ